MKSSYSQCLINIAHFFQALSLATNPQKIVEIGVLEGFSLTNLTKHTTCSDVQIYDLFEDFKGNHANLEKTRQNFPNAIINKGDFYKIINNFTNYSIDILHIDIANDGDVYEFALTNYMEKLSHKGVMLLEGGSEERDNVEWMKKYNKRRINPVIKTFQNKYNILNIGDFPSLTVATKKKQ